MRLLHAPLGRKEPTTFFTSSYFNRDVNDEAELDPEVEDLIAKEEHWLEEWNSGDGDECMEVDENDRETNKLDDETLAQIKRLFDKTLNAEAENRFAVWETIAERVCAFTGQVSTLSALMDKHRGDKETLSDISEILKLNLILSDYCYSTALMMLFKVIE